MKDQQIDECLNILFSPVLGDKEDDQCADADTAFRNLVGAYFEAHYGARSGICKKLLSSVYFDSVGVMAMLKRFQRDAFGLMKFSEITRKMVEIGDLSEAAQKIINQQASELGLRVTSNDPRKTRIASTFTFWMCVFRPVSIDVSRFPGLPASWLVTLCARINFWISSTYLLKFGDINLYDLQDFVKRYERIKHDFTYREVGFSTLETLYCSYWRERDPKPKSPERSM